MILFSGFPSLPKNMFRCVRPCDLLSLFWYLQNGHVDQRKKCSHQLNEWWGLRTAWSAASRPPKDWCSVKGLPHHLLQGLGGKALKPGAGNSKIYTFFTKKNVKFSHRAQHSSKNQVSRSTCFRGCLLKGLCGNTIEEFLPRHFLVCNRHWSLLLRLLPVDPSAHAKNFKYYQENWHSSVWIENLFTDCLSMFPEETTRRTDFPMFHFPKTQLKSVGRQLSLQKGQSILTLIR